MSVNLGSAHGLVKLDVSGIKTAVDAAKSQLNGLQGALSKVGSGMKKGGMMATAAVTAPLAIMAKGAVRLGALGARRLLQI